MASSEYEVLLIRHPSPVDIFTCGINPIEMFCCIKCDFKTQISIFLRKHLEEVHSSYNETTPYKVKHYTCTKCSFQTFSSLHWLKHVTSNSFGHFNRNSFRHFNNSQTVKPSKPHLRKQKMPNHTIENGNGNIDTCDCAIENLKVKSFDVLTFVEKIKTVEEGQPKPTLTIATKLKSCVRHFTVKIYDNEPWLCGCKALNKLFCWPCLLFSKDKTVWNTTGYDDLNNIYRSGKRHRDSADHITCEKQLHLFGKSQRIEFALSNQYKLSIEKHNEEVKKNREIMAHLIRATCFLGKQGLAFKGNFVAYLNEMARNDNLLKTHLENSTVFRGLSPNIQNDLIAAVADVLTKEIKTEISKAKFVALIMDETSDRSMKAQLTTILRYVTEKGKVQERFLHFTDYSSDRTANCLLQHFLKVLKDFNCTEKLVAQSYDGAVIRAGEYPVYSAKLRENSWSPVFVHCYAHNLNLVLSQSVSFIKPVKVFFTNIAGFSTFFSNSTKRTNALDLLVTRAPTRWNFHNRVIQTVNEHRDALECLFESIVDNKNVEWDSESVMYAGGLLDVLRDFEFNFFLMVFSSIFPHCNILIKKITDIDYCAKRINDIKQLVANLRNDFEQFWHRMEEFAANYPPSKRCRLIPDKKNTYRRLFNEILDVIVLNLNQRFCEMYKLNFLSLFDQSRFNDFASAFPEKAFAMLKQHYGQFFDLARLKSELIVMYKDPDMKKSSIFELHEYINSLQLSSVFPELSKLVVLCLTFPVTSCSFSRLKRVKDYLKKAQGQDRSSQLGLIYVESELLQHLRASPLFEEEVIEVFSEKNPRIELSFKK